MIETGTTRQRAVLALVDTGAYDADTALEELSSLAKTAGAQVVGAISQRLPHPNNATYLGSGKLLELKEMVDNMEADLLICDDELSGSQLRNLEDALGIDVIDRTLLILDIFAGRALSGEGKLQVELAQQRYLLPRLIGMGKKLSRQQGGIGSRGPGETKLESDRRHIRRRIEALESALEQLAQRRDRQRARRRKDGYPTVALVGYTNVGKSSLLNRLTRADVMAADMLFATLDPTARLLRLPDGKQAMLIDTVGLLRRLPHPLIHAFHSTLAEVAEADLILNLCDASDPLLDEQLEVTRSLLGELSCEDTPVLTVYNKADLLPVPFLPPEKGVLISVKTGEGLDVLLERISELLPKQAIPPWMQQAEPGSTPAS